MIHPAETAAASCVAALRAAPRPIRPDSGKEIVPKVYFSWDNEQTQVALDIADDPAALLDMKAEIVGNPRWMNLSIALGPAEFALGDVIGLAVLAEGEVALTPLLRSREGNAVQDTGLGGSLTFGPGSRPGVLLHKLTGADPAVGAARFHTLILPLPKQSFYLRLLDLRLFVVPVAADAEPDLPRLGSFAV
jgi:hypothetical protein